MASFTAQFFSYSLAIAGALLLTWRFGPQRRSWHALSLLASFAAVMATPAEWHSAAARLVFNFATALLIAWGVGGFMPRLPYQHR